MKQALVGLEGVRSVKDEWDTDTLHVTYDPEQITLDQLLERIAQEGFEAEIKKGS